MPTYKLIKTSDDNTVNTGNKYEHNCSQLKPSVYIYSVLVGNKLQTEKFVIAK